jgi:lipid-binding SYLF domain-containing protein
MRTIVAFLGACLLVFAANGVSLAADDAQKLEKERAAIKKASAEILSELYRVQPAAKKAIGAAAGYATFSNFGMKILVAGSGSGKGLAVKKGSKPVYMKMFEVQAGLGLGIKKFKLVFVFETADAFDDFVNSGWESSAQASAAAKSGDKGKALTGAVSVSKGVWLYQLVDKGLAVEATIKGTKYYKDDDLN